MRLEWSFEKVPMTANKVGRHWRYRYSEKKSWSEWIFATAGNGPWLYESTELEPEPVKLAVTVWRTRLQDPDNAMASLKPLLDALKHRGWLADDSSEYLELTLSEKKCGREETRTQVIWEGPEFTARRRARLRARRRSSGSPHPA